MDTNNLLVITVITTTVVSQFNFIIKEFLNMIILIISKYILNLIGKKMIIVYDSVNYLNKLSANECYYLRSIKLGQNEYPDGYFYKNRNFFGYLKIDTSYKNTLSADLMIICNKNLSFKKLNEMEVTTLVSKRYGNLGSKKHIINLNLKPYEWQRKLFDDVCNHYYKHMSATICIHGKSGIGKSTFGLFLIKHFKYSYYFEKYNPMNNVNYFDYIYDYSNPSKSNPLIIILNEYDNVLSNIFNKKINKLDKSEFNDKLDWNNWLDQIQKSIYNIYPYVILILTSNKNKSEIVKICKNNINDKDDDSCISKDRINFMVEL
jgi:hypothetical protein